jgi:hypothetical protein
VELNTEIYRHLSSHSGLTSLLGTWNSAGGPAPCIFPGERAEQGCERPYLTFQRITTEPTYTLGQADERNMSADSVQFDIYADDPDAAKAVAAQLKRALTLWSSPAIEFAFVEQHSDHYEADVKLYRDMVTARIWNHLTAP